MALQLQGAVQYDPAQALPTPASSNSPFLFIFEYLITTLPACFKLIGISLVRPSFPTLLIMASSKMRTHEIPWNLPRMIMLFLVLALLAVVVIIITTVSYIFPSFGYKYVESLLIGLTNVCPKLCHCLVQRRPFFACPNIIALPSRGIKSSIFELRSFHAWRYLFYGSQSASLK